MQPMHNVHPSKRHSNSNSLHNLYDTDPQYINANPQTPTSSRTYAPHPNANTHTPTRPSRAHTAPRNAHNQPQYYSQQGQSSSFTEAHSNNNNPLSNVSIQSLKSSQSIPSPLQSNRNHSHPKKTNNLTTNNSNSHTMYANSNPMSGLQHPSIGASISNNEHKSNPNGTDTLSNNDPNLFTLHGILRIMKQSDPNYQMVTLGMDLTQLGGLDLNCPEPEIHHTFLSPWLDKWDDSQKFVTPQCYKLKHTEHSPIKFIKRYKETTLFYIFHTCVNDKMQVIAAKELYQRHWVYHTGLQLWLKSGESKGKKTKGDKGSDSEQKTDKSDEDRAIVFMKTVKVECIEYFDVETWSVKKHFYNRFPMDWNQERKKLLHESQLNYFYKACTDSYPKGNRHQH